MNSTTQTKYPAGALLRVKDICGDRKAGLPGLLPIVSRTWIKWAASGRISRGVLLGPRTRAWRIEEVLAVSGQVAGDGPSAGQPPVATGAERAAAAVRKQGGPVHVPSGVRTKHVVAAVVPA